MKKNYITLLFLLVSLSTFSQNSGEIEFGFFGGVSISNVSTVDNQLQSKSRVGFNGGFFGNYFFSQSWSLKGKVFYNQNGWEEDLSGSSSLFGTDVTYTLHYISVAIKPSWHFGKNKNWYLNLGPYISFLAGANADTTQVKDSFNSTDVGLESDIGIKFPVSKNGSTFLFVELTGQAGFTDIFKDNQGDAIRNNRSSLNVGIVF